VFAHYEEYALKRDAGKYLQLRSLVILSFYWFTNFMVSGKAQVAQASLDFEINKYQCQLAINNKTVKL
jgi:hypothetical protein